MAKQHGVAYVLVKDGAGVSFVVDQHLVGAFFADAADEPFCIAVGPRRAEIRTASKLSVNLASRSRIRKRKRGDLIAQVHQEVAGGLGGRGRGRVRGHSENVHGADFHDEQNLESAQRDRVEGEEVGGK